MGRGDGVADGGRRGGPEANDCPRLATGPGNGLSPDERQWLEARLDRESLRMRGLGVADFEPWSACTATVGELLRMAPATDRIRPESSQLRRQSGRLEGQQAVLAVIALREETGEVFVYSGRHLIKAAKELGGEDQEIRVFVGQNRSGYRAQDLYRLKKILKVNQILFGLEKELKAFASGLTPRWADEFDGLESVLTKYVHFDIRNGKVDYTLVGYLVDNIVREMERLVKIGLPFTQEVCGPLAQEYEHIGSIYDDLGLVEDDADQRSVALLGYELANVWYRAAQSVESGIFPVRAQLGIVNNMVRLGALSRHRGTIRRAIHELGILLDTDRFKDEFLALVSRRGNDRSLSEEEQQDLVHGFLDTRRRFRSEVRATMAEAIKQFHLCIPVGTKAAFSALEKAILGGREPRGPTALFRFLRANLTVISELEYVEGGRDCAVATAGGTRYMNMLEHAEEVTRALEALEAACRARARGDAPAEADGGVGYFYGRLERRDRGRASFQQFAELFADVVDDYEAFTRSSPVSMLNAWMGMILHDLGTLLLERHHEGGAKIAQSLLAALDLPPGRQQSIRSYIENHGEYKRFYLLEKSPRSLLAFVHGCEAAGAVPAMVLEKRRIESIVDLAATGEGLLPIGFLETTRTRKSVADVEDVAARFGTLRRSVWGLAGSGGLYEDQVSSEERDGFLDRYFDEMRIVYYHNLRRELSPQGLLNFHYLSARTVRLSGLPVATVRLASDRPEHLRLLEERLARYTVPELRRDLDAVEQALGRVPPEDRTRRLLGELRSRLDLIVELRDGDTLLWNTKLGYEIEQRRSGEGGR